MLEVPHNVKIYSAAPYFYNLEEKVGHTVRYIVRFDEEIDGDALNNAFESTMKRYTYLRLKLVRGRAHSIYGKLFGKDNIRQLQQAYPWSSYRNDICL